MTLNLDLVITSYAKLIIAGQKTIDNVPTNLQSQVSAKIIELQA